MAAAEVLTPGTTAANSSDITITAGAPLVVCLKGPSGSGSVGVAGTRGQIQVFVELKDEDSIYWTVGILTSEKPSMLLEGPGVYRVRRPAGPSVGAFTG